MRTPIGRLMAFLAAQSNTTNWADRERPGEREIPLSTQPVNNTRGKSAHRFCLRSGVKGGGTPVSEPLTPSYRLRSADKLSDQGLPLLHQDTRDRIAEAAYKGFPSRAETLAKGVSATKSSLCTTTLIRDVVIIVKKNTSRAMIMNHEA